MALALAGGNIVRAGVLLAGLAIASTIAVTPVLAQDYSAIIASSLGRSRGGCLSRILTEGRD